MDITREFLDRFNDNALYRTLGIMVEQVSDGRAGARLTPQSPICWPFPDQPHGGVLFTLMDTTMAWAVLSIVEPGKNCTTIDLSIQYTAPAKGSVFTCRTRIEHTTRRMAFVRGEVLDVKDRVVALGQGTFRIINSDPFEDLLPPPGHPHENFA